MDDIQIRLQAAIGEGQQLVVILTQRCMTLAGELAAANEKLAALAPKPDVVDSR